MSEIKKSANFGDEPGSETSEFPWHPFRNPLGKHPVPLPSHDHSGTKEFVIPRENYGIITAIPIEDCRCTCHLDGLKFYKSNYDFANRAPIGSIAGEAVACCECDDNVKQNENYKILLQFVKKLYFHENLGLESISSHVIVEAGEILKSIGEL